MSMLSRRKVLAAGAFAIAAGSVRAHNGTHHVKIEWTNTDPFAHTATVKGGWEVMIPPGAVATHVVEAGDTVEYYCRFLPNMKGSVTVKVE